MPKFSIIIPVYNIEKYIQKCIESVINQTYKNYEIIVINDGTKDKSIELIKNYPVKIINQKNQGLSQARNRGVKESSGEYIIFLDGDDTWNNELLENINYSLKNDPDLVRFQIRTNYDESSITKEYEEIEFNEKKGEEAFEIISKFHFVELACCYAIKKEYFLKNKFEFMPNTMHEDFGLIPLVIIKAKKVNCINYIGYNYLQRTGSIMNNNDYNKTVKKVNDIYTHYKNLIIETEKNNIKSKVFKSFISNSLILKITSLKNNEYKKYKKILKEEKVYDNLMDDTILRKFKKLLIQISPKLYYKIKRK